MADIKAMQLFEGGSGIDPEWERGELEIQDHFLESQQ
jgi:hypothetical protein